MAPPCRRVAVLGTGVSGLAAIKTCLEEGLEVVAFESRPCIGGVWSGVKDQWATEGPTMYASLVTNTSKSMTCYSDFPCPASYPPYLPYKLFNDYLGLYADNFQLKPHIKFNTRVVEITRTADHMTTGRWCVSSESETGERTQEIFDGVIVCAGFYSQAWIPEFPGLRDKFRGRVLHAKDYRNCTDFVGRTVLVIGNASSAGDIACDTSNVAKQVYLSAGNGCTVVSRVGPATLPADLAIKRIYTVFLSPEKILQIIEKMANKKFDHRKSGLLYTGRRQADCPIMVNDDIPARIFAGRVKVVPYVTEFQEHGFTTTDGKTYTDIDDVVFGTGYKRDLSMLDESLNCGGDKLELYKQVFPVGEKHHTLAIVGCIRAIGPMPPTLELQARLAAYTLSGRHKLPPQKVMKADIDKLNEMTCRPDGTYKYSYLGIFIADNIASEIGVKPSFWKLVMSGKLSLALKCFFGGAYPFHYRMMGPGIWSGAEAAIDNVLSENQKPLQNRPVPLPDTNVCTITSVLKTGMAILTVLLAVAYFTNICQLLDHS